MKKFMITSILIALLATGNSVMAQGQQEESLGLPGDNLNLYAVMKLFQESETLEGFEKNLNDENSRINNLDLNDDNFVDYIRIIDYVDGNIHNIVLQVAIDAKENQDVAVFTVQREANGQVDIQLTGDEALYGKDYIIEPIFDDAQGQTPNPGYTGNTNQRDGQNVTVYRTTRVTIATWPVVRFIYMPAYSGWHSSWYWGYYPSYWHPWQPYYWHYYYGYHYNWYDNYYGHYRRWNTHRYTRWNDYYYVGKRAHSVNVNVKIQAGNYKKSYSHPEQRRDGEALYTRTNPAPDRRSSSTTTTRTATKPTSEQKSTATRRSTTTVTSKSVQKPATSSTRRSSTNTKPAATVNKSEKKKETETKKPTRR